MFEDGVRMNYGYIRWLCSLSVPVFILVLMLMVQKKVGRLSWWTPLLVLSCLISIAWAFFTSSRTALIVLGIQAVMVSHFLKKPSLRSPASLLKKVLKWGLPVLILFLIMATLRENKHSREEVTESLILTGPIHRIIGSGNFFGVAKTSIALDQIPRPVDYLYGKSLITWIYSPIPRSLWPDKPSMGLGFQFGEEVLGYNMERIKNGKTPSLPVEFYWNFGWPGALLGILGFGFFSGQVLPVFQATVRKSTYIRNRALRQHYLPCLHVYDVHQSKRRHRSNYTACCHYILYVADYYQEREIIIPNLAFTFTPAYLMNLRELAKEIISRLHLSTWVSRRVLSKEHAVLHGTFKPKSKIKSILLYTTVKCASSVTHKVLFELARKKDADYSHINLFRYYYNFNKDPDVAFSKDVDTALLPQGIVYAPLRRAFFPNNHDKYSVLIILRDPRDVLVSAYFSIRKSHVLPMNPHIREGLLSERRKAQEETIDEYALRCAPQFIEYYKKLCSLLSPE